MSSSPVNVAVNSSQSKNRIAYGTSPLRVAVEFRHACVEKSEFLSPLVGGKLAPWSSPLPSLELADVQVSQHFNGVCAFQRSL